jgi:L-fucose mutarotase
MLIGIHPLLNAEILHVLASMGHGDDLVICDANFPATSVAASTILEQPIQMGVDALTALEAILTVFPIDTFDLEIPPVRGMEIVGKPNEIPEIVKDAQTILTKVDASTKLVERHAFYDSARKAFAVIRTTESRHYGNFILRKGVV